MKDSELYIEKMDVSEITEVANMLTDAFETNPAYSLIFNETSQPRKGLLWLFRTNLLLNNRKKILTYVIKEKESQKIIGTYTVIPPKRVNVPLSAYFEIGLLQFIFEFGLRTLSKMMSLDNYNKKILNTSIKVERYYYLSMVVVKEEYRGCGVGSYAIRNCLENLSKTRKGCNLLGLTTQLSENVVFYSKLGFEKIDGGEIVFKKNRYYNCNMKYTFENYSIKGEIKNKL